MAADADGNEDPICPVCRDPIKPGESVARPNDHFVHARCYRKALEQERNRST